MNKSIKLLCALALLGSASFAAAQETTTEPETAPADTSGAVVLDVGEPVVEAAEQTAESATYIREESGDWFVQCLRVEEGEEPCQMIQRLVDDNDNAVADVTLFRLVNQGKVIAGGTFIVPLETLLTQKLVIQVDSGQARRYDFSLCTTIGCIARVGFTQSEIDAFKRGAVAKVTIVPALAPDQKVVLDMSLTGFTKAFDVATPMQP